MVPVIGPVPVGGRYHIRKDPLRGKDGPQIPVRIVKRRIVKLF